MSNRKKDQEEMSLKLFILWFIVFVISSTSAILVNKYILSSLHFTYPTIFQSWQMGVATIILFCLHKARVVQLQVLTLSAIVSWLPAVLFFTLSIYSGSVALSKLPVPVFFLIQQVLLHNLVLLSDKYIIERPIKPFETCLVVLSLTSVLYVVIEDGQFSYHRNKWIFFHCVSLGLYSFYAQFCTTSMQLELEEIDKMILNSTSSIFLLLLFGIVSGETKIVQDFPLLFARHFHVGCLGSGIFGSGVMISYSHLTKLVGVRRVRFYNVGVSIVVSILSIFTFTEIILTATKIFFTLSGLFTVIILSHFYSKPESRSEVIVTSELEKTTLL